MNTTNLLSKLINSDKFETVIGLNQALECFGVQQDPKNLSQDQANEIGKAIFEKFASLADVKSVAESIKDLISVEELESFKHELALKLSNNVNTAKTSIHEERIDTLKNCFDGVSGDNVL